MTNVTIDIKGTAAQIGGSRSAQTSRPVPAA